MTTDRIRERSAATRRRPSGTRRTASVPPSRPVQPDRAAQFRGHQRAHDLQPEPIRPFQAESVRQARPSSWIDHVQPARRPLRPDRHRARPLPGSNACSMAFCTSSVSTMTSGVARSAENTPRLPSRRIRDRRRVHGRDVGHHRQQPVHDLDRDRPLRPPTSTASRAPRRSTVTRRTDSVSATRASSLLGAPRLQPQQRRHGLQVVLHPVVNLADRRVLAQQRPVAALHLGDVADQHRRTRQSSVRTQRERAQQHRRPARLDFHPPPGLVRPARPGCRSPLPARRTDR